MPGFYHHHLHALCGLIPWDRMPRLARVQAGYSGQCGLGWQGFRGQSVAQQIHRNIFRLLLEKLLM